MSERCLLVQPGFGIILSLIFIFLDCLINRNFLSPTTASTIAACSLNLSSGARFTSNLSAPSAKDNCVFVFHHSPNITNAL